MTTKTKIMDVPYGDKHGNKYTLVSMEFNAYNFPLSTREGEWVHDHFIILHFVRNKDGKEYRANFLNRKVDLRYVRTIPANGRGKCPALFRKDLPKSRWNHLI